MGKIAAFLIVIYCVGVKPLSTAAQPSPAAPSQTATNRAPQHFLGEVLKLLQAHSDPGVVIGFIKQWPAPYLTSTEDIDQLRRAGAAPAVLEAYVQRGAQLRLKNHLAQVASSNTTNVPALIVLPAPRSYEYSPGPEISNGTPYYFSDALWWWANYYPYPYPPYSSYPWGWPGGAGFHRGAHW